MAWCWPVDEFIVTVWHHFAAMIYVNIASDNGLLPDGTKPSPELKLNYHHWDPLALTQDQFSQE